jgi:hypothetical protein
MQGNDFQDDWGISVVHLNGLEGPVTNGWITQNTFFDNLVNINIDINGPVTVDIVNNFLGRQMTVRGGQSANIYLVGDALAGNNDVDVFFNTLAAADFGIQVDHDSELTVYGNIFTELNIEAIDLYSIVDVTTTIDTNLFFHNTSIGTVGSNPIYADPMLADPINGDFHLLPGSGAIDSAAATDFDVDIDGDHRPVGFGSTPYDLGADEFCYSTWLPLVIK